MFKTVLALLLANPILLAAVDLNREADLRRFVAQVAENERKNRFREMGYFYRLQNHRIILDRRGREKKRTSSTYEVIPLDDGVYRKLIRRNGKPLSEREARKQQRKAEARLRRQRNPSPKGRAKRERKQAERRRKEALFWEEAVRAFHFHYRGEEVLNGRPVAVVDLLPREKYRPPRKGIVDSGQAQGPDMDRQRGPAVESGRDGVRQAREVSRGAGGQVVQGIDPLGTAGEIAGRGLVPPAVRGQNERPDFSGQGTQHEDDRRVFRLPAFRNQRADAAGGSTRRREFSE